jgi:GH15 family glucan-1,4-alpha-glucosidase
VPGRIEDYAFLSDLHTAALVGRDGSMDWLSFPRFDSPACFAALLGTPDHGRWLLAPAGGIKRTTRGYRNGTLILETVFETDDGEVALVDLMPPRDERPDVVRIVEGRRGRVPMQMELVIRFDYGSIVPWVRRVDGALVAVAGPDSLRLTTPVRMRGEDFRTRAEFSVSAGERVPFVLTWLPSYEHATTAVDGLDALESTQSWWCAWSDRCDPPGDYAADVRASLVVLKGLIHQPTGGLVAAATTSLPERIGGVRNWDYRACWLRDATFTLLAMINAGFHREASAWRDWLLRAVAGEPSKLQIVYGVAGEHRLPEMELPWLPGYEGSSPVRIGNDAALQFQLDVWGEVLDVIAQSHSAGLDGRAEDWRLALVLLEDLEGRWREPDDGLWEVRGDRQHFTHSKVMAWVAFDRAIRLAEGAGIDAPVDRWKQLRADIRAEVLDKGVDERGRFVQHYGSSDLDASLLMVPLVGFLPPSDDRVRNTVDAIATELTKDGFVSRYRTRESLDGLPPGEGAFLLCSFWLADALWMIGRRDDALELFHRLLALRNDVGLLAEEYDPKAKRFLGNFPQAFSHTALVNTAAVVSSFGSRRSGIHEDEQHRRLARRFPTD